jgi:hypothetical protein
MVELATRESGTLEISLIWNENARTVSVSVTESATGDTFSFAVENRNALDAYYHPYAYAGPEYAGPPSPEPRAGRATNRW